MIADAAGAADLLRGIASLMWPLVILSAILIFRLELRQVLRRIRRWKGFGQEVELDRSLDNLQQQAESAASQLPVQPVVIAAPPAGAEAVMPRPVVEARSATSVTRSVEEGPPEAALVLLGRDLEVELRTLTASMGFLARHSARRSVMGYVETLESSGFVSSALAQAIRDFWRVRNQIVHGKPVSDRAVLRAIDIGIGLLDAVRSIPHEQNFIHHPGTDVFSDSEGAHRREGVLALVLRTVPTDGAEYRRAFPTTKSNYVAGQRVAWEWNDDRQWGESWYRDPDTGQIAYAWTGSLEFVGRPLDEIDRTRA